MQTPTSDLSRGPAQQPSLTIGRHNILGVSTWQKSQTLPLFDRLRRVDDEYVQTLMHGKHKIVFRFEADSRKELERILPSAVKFWRSRVRWFKAFRDFAAKKLLRLLNDNLDCGENDHADVTADQLRKALPAPFSVRFTLLSRLKDPLDEGDDPDQVIFDLAGGEDEEVLQENCIQVTGNLKEGITEGDVETLL